MMIFCQSLVCNGDCICRLFVNNHSFVKEYCKQNLQTILGSRDPKKFQDTSVELHFSVIFRLLLDLRPKTMGILTIVSLSLRSFG